MKTLCRTIIWTVCFLELSQDDAVHPDSAVKALEDIAATLQEATEDEKVAFAETCVEEANRLVAEANPEYFMTSKFIRGLPESMGL